MTLADEVWIVSDFTELASGVADDDAKERVPLQLAVQEAQDHVQRVQADIASREERIHLIQDDIQAAKDEITGLVKKSQADSQAIYDNQGKALDDEYASHMEALRQAISGRATSLKLPYTPDPAYPSPEVWANAYRLALYETPPGVDGVKEHQWIADQMKQWRDFEKSVDDRSEQIREEAAAAKQEAAPKITDLNAKIDDLNGRIAATQTEEDPLKAELSQAQADLAAAQAADAGLDDKYYGQLNALPGENISYHIPLQADGRFTWVPDNPFGEDEVQHVYRIFSRAIRADGRQYWSLSEFIMKKNETTEITIEPGSFESTKEILRPNLSPDEIEQ
jgi:septal ring factor EnvC (AmiA/AmiB activator)